MTVNFVPIDPGNLADVSAFVNAHPLLPHDPGDLVGYIKDLTLAPDRVLDLWLDGKRVAVAVLVDACVNPANSAELALMASALPTFSKDALATLVQHAKSLLGKGPRHFLDIATHSQSPVEAQQLKQLGFTLCYRVFRMERDLLAEPNWENPKRNWVNVSDPWIEPYYVTVKEAFGQNPETSIPPFDVFTLRALRFGIPARLLVEANRVLAFTRVAELGSGNAEIVTVGRSPGLRGKGLGTEALQEAIRLLRERGNRRVKLQVMESNQAALRLYEKHGFSIAGSVDIYRSQLD